MLGAAMERVRREREHETDRPARPVAPPPAPAEQILRLQQGAGNAAVARMLAREPSDAPALDAPADTFSGDQLSSLLSHLQDQIAQAKQESDANQIAERSRQAPEIQEPAPRSGLLGTLAKPLRRLGSALKNAGRRLGIGGRGKPAATAPSSAAPEEAADRAEQRELAALAAKINLQIDEEMERLAATGASMSAAVEAISEMIEPSEREAIVKQQSA